LRSGLAWLFVLLAALPASSQTSASSPRPVREFVAEMDRLSAALSTAAPQELDAVAATVPLRW
jgi:hypothetical protein